MWRRYRDYCGGPLADMGAHHFDIVQWALGMDGSGPVEILPPTEEGAQRGATLVYANGTRVVHGGPSGATFVGTGGMIHVDRGRIASVPDNLLTDPLPAELGVLGTYDRRELFGEHLLHHYQPGQDREPTRAFHKRADRRLVHRAGDQVALPMLALDSILEHLGTLVDRANRNHET